MPQDAPRLTGLGTAVPPHVLNQDAVRERARTVFGRERADLDRLLPAFDNAGVRRRYACLPLESYGAPMGWADRNARFESHATDLLAAAAERTLADAGLAPEAVDAVVTVSTTGIATPSLDAHLLNCMPFRTDLERLPVFGLGCCGGVLGLGRAAALARAKPARRVLLLAVELCALTFRPQDASKANVIAAALFGDGAAGALLSTHPDDAGPGLLDWGEHTWPGTRDVMGWRVADDGLGVLFAQAIPGIVRARYGSALDAFLARNALSRRDFAGYAFHPGGAKVLDAFEGVLGLAEGELTAARSILRDYGNMSAPTALFVLDRLRRCSAHGPILASALGPGFTAGFALFQPDGRP